jgi:SnoaL-like domain
VRDIARKLGPRGGGAAGDRVMPIDTLARWHRLVQTHDRAGLADLIADDAVFHSPVVHRPQAGKTLVLHYLHAAFEVFFNPSFRYVRELVGARDAVLEFEVEIDAISVNGVDMIRWDESGRITDFKVMIRPLKAVNLVHQKMAAMLQSQA